MVVQILIALRSICKSEQLQYLKADNIILYLEYYALGSKYGLHLKISDIGLIGNAAAWGNFMCQAYCCLS